MSFTSIAFIPILFLAIAFRFSFGRTKQEKSYLFSLMVLSVVFYGWHVPSYLLIMLTSTAVDFFAAKLMTRPDLSARRRSALLTLSVVVNIGLLGFFKYAGFFLEELHTGLSLLGVSGAAFTSLEIALPIGISFYTFQSMSYSIDVYRGIQKPEPVFWRFFLFVSFFPQLVAGPIVRSRDFLYQIGRRRRISFRVVSEGVHLLIRGLFLKLVLADNLAHIVDLRWNLSSEASGSGLFCLALISLFSFQIYCDFAGYSNIARGVAYLLGFRLPVNFNAPYLAGSFADFWRRWHITLSQWLRDYLYVPLGGNRRSEGRTMFNMFAVMFLGGLWHGAAGHFIVWGVIHGVALAIERMLGLREAHKSSSAWLRVSWYLVVQVFVLVAWAFFRAESVADAVELLSRVFSLQGGGLPRDLQIASLVYLTPVILMHARTYLAETYDRWVFGAHEKILTTALMLFLILIGYGRGGSFIYFQF